MSRFKRMSHAIWHCEYHIVWTRKYRYRVMQEKVKEQVERCIRKPSRPVGCEVVEFKVQVGHVHTLVQIPPKVSISEYRAEKDDSYLGGKEAGLLIGFSRDTIEKRATPWEEEHVPFKIRYVEAVLDKDAKPVRRYYKPDVLAFLRRPPGRDNGPVYIPIFKAS